VRQRGPAFGAPIAPGVHVIGPTKRGAGKGGYSRCYLFEDGDELTLVDTGWDDDAHMVLKYLASVGRSPVEIEHIALTHAHRSHLGGLATLAELSRAEVSCHAAEADIVEGKERARPIRLWPLRPLVLMPFRIVSHLPIAGHRPCRVHDRSLVEGSEVGPLSVLHTPGHTPGHLAFLYDDSVLVVGDAIATWPEFGPGWPGFNLDEEQYRESLERLVELEPQVVGPGHGDPIVEDTANRVRALSRRGGLRRPRATA
jgi:glyoxylase-like metal-dependent hydrolase (beta-lactamase superfamily II)